MTLLTLLLCVKGFLPISAEASSREIRKQINALEEEQQDVQAQYAENEDEIADSSQEESLNVKIPAQPSLS